MTDRLPEMQELSQPQTIEFPREWHDHIDTSHFWMMWRLRAFHHAVAELSFSLDEPHRILDIGCGRGLLRRQLETSTGWTVDGTDLDRHALSLNANGRGTTYLYDIQEKNPELREKYDALSLFDVLEHIEDPVPFLRDALFHLKKGGFVFINVPAIPAAYSLYDTVSGHYRRYNTKSLGALASDAGVEIASIRYWGLALVPVLFLRSALMRLKRNHSPESVVSAGMMPPNRLTNEILVGIMKLETLLLCKPLLGTSLLLTGRRS